MAASIELSMPVLLVTGLFTRAAALVLMTCYPFDAVERGPLRYVVFAEAK